MDARVKAQIVAVASPMLALVVARVLFAPIPVTASSAGLEAVTHEAPAPAPSGKLSAEQERMLEWCAAQESGPAASPFLNELFPSEAPPTRVVEIAPEPETTPPTDDQPAAGLRLSAVLGGSDGGVAFISGKMYNVGQAIRPGLTLTRIDARSSLVEMTDAQGRVWKLSCEK